MNAIPTHFRGRPLGRFSPVASAFCKDKEIHYSYKIFAVSY